MKRFAVILAILLAVCLSANAAPLRYRYQQADLLVALRDGASALAEAVEQLHAEHPLIMTDEWAAKLTAQADALNVTALDLNTEYDIFEDKTTSWFGDHKAASLDDVCVVFPGRIDFVLPVEKYIGIQHCIAVVNENVRVRADIKDGDHGYEGAQKYERFSLSTGLFDTKDIDRISSVVIRFYGRNDSDTVDYALDDEEVLHLDQVVQNKKANKAAEALIREWARAVDDIDDFSFPPESFTIFLKNDYPIFPENTKTEDLHQVANIGTNALEETLERCRFIPGEVYFLPGTVERINEPTEASPRRTWEIRLKQSYNTQGQISVLVIVDYAEEQGWITEEPKVGDEIIVIGTYAGFGVPSFMNKFYVGHDEYIDGLIPKGK